LARRSAFQHGASGYGCMNSARGRSPAGWLKDAEGSSATEFALVLPLLLLLMISAFEVGRLYWSYNVVSAAVRDSSRYASRLTMNCSGFANSANTAVVQRLTRTGTVDTGAAPLLPNWTSDASVTITFGCVDNSSSSYLGLYDGVAQIPTVTVAASAPYAVGLTGFLPGFRFNAIKARHSETWGQQ